MKYVNDGFVSFHSSNPFLFIDIFSKKSKSAVADLIKGIVASLMTLVIFLSANMAHSETMRQISVSGQGEVSATIDYVKLQFAIENEAANANMAKDSNDAAFKQVMALSKRFKISKSDIQAEQIQRFPQYTWQKQTDNTQKRVYSGEKIRRTISFNIRNMERYPDFVHELSRQEFIRIYSTQGMLNDYKAYRTQAMRLALLDAKDKAKSMLGVYGEELGIVLAIEEQGGTPVAPMLKQARMMANDERAPAEFIFAPQIIKQSIAVTFKISESTVK